MLEPNQTRHRSFRTHRVEEEEVDFVLHAAHGLEAPVPVRERPEAETVPVLVPQETHARLDHLLHILFVHACGQTILPLAERIRFAHFKRCWVLSTNTNYTASVVNRKTNALVLCAPFPGTVVTTVKKR